MLKDMFRGLQRWANIKRYGNDVAVDFEALPAIPEKLTDLQATRRKVIDKVRKALLDHGKWIKEYSYVGREVYYYGLDRDIRLISWDMDTLHGEDVAIYVKGSDEDLTDYGLKKAAEAFVKIQLEEEQRKRDEALIDNYDKFLGGT